MSLAITYDEVRRRLGRFLDIGRDPSTWQPVDVDDVADIISNGLRHFYFAADESGRYVWSFLRATGTITLAADVATYSLPSDFGGMAGVGFVPSESGHRIVSELPEEKMRTLLAVQNLSGYPQYWAIAGRAAQDGVTTQYEVSFYPRPEGPGSLTFRYVRNPDTIGSHNQYPLGAEKHSQTILAAILAEADAVLNDPDKPSFQAEEFRRLLAQSITTDREGFGFYS